MLHFFHFNYLFTSSKVGPSPGKNNVSYMYFHELISSKVHEIWCHLFFSSSFSYGFPWSPWQKTICLYWCANPITTCLQYIITRAQNGLKNKNIRINLILKIFAINKNQYNQNNQYKQKPQENEFQELLQNTKNKCLTNK